MLFLKVCDFLTLIRIFIVTGEKERKEKKVKNLRRFVSVALSLAFVVCCWNIQTITSEAEETTVPGYHEYVDTDAEVIDTWYGIARGTYLQSGTSGLKRAGKAKVSASGTTNANYACDKVKLSIYLDESSNGGSSFGTIGSYHFEEKNTTSCHGSKANISVTSGWKYRVRGVHSVIEGSTVETTSTCTTNLTAS